MADNPGAYPLDPLTEVGRFRLMIGDTSSEPFDLPVPGTQNYSLFSDDEIKVFLEQSESHEGAAQLAYLQLAGSAALAASNIQDFDLKVSTEKRAEYLIRMAQMWGDKADALSADIFEIFDVNIDNGRDCYPELAARPWRGFRGC